MVKTEWNLENSCEGKFKINQKVTTRGDCGRFHLIITEIHNSHYCTCKNLWLFGIKCKKRHFNMNMLEAT